MCLRVVLVVNGSLIMTYYRILSKITHFDFTRSIFAAVVEISAQELMQGRAREQVIVNLWNVRIRSRRILTPPLGSASKFWNWSKGLSFRSSLSTVCSRLFVRHWRHMFVIGDAFSVIGDTLFMIGDNFFKIGDI